MGFKKVLVGAAAALALATGAANAGWDRDGWYLGLEGGWVGVAETDVINSGLFSLEFDNGWGVLGTAGYAFHDSRWRLEGEVGYRTNDISEVNGFPVVVASDLEEWSGMINAVYDLPVKSERFGLSVGVGAGIDNARLNLFGFEDNDKTFAAQGIVGMTYRLGAHTDLMLNYRYLWVDPPDLAVFGGANSEMDLTKHTVTIGFRYGYEDPPVAPVVVPQVVVPPAPKTFIIFFGFNKCNITAEADAVLSEAAASAKSSGSASVRIVGHTDTVGSNSYNQKLSECRANAAKSNLVGKGVSEGSISTSGKGESELMVQTGDSVKEPQNRRATVDIN
jgi:hypothetical protein